ncbi:MAG: ESX secretion-associated protein EspG [Pseudonocardiaceae bacterium]
MSWKLTVAQLGVLWQQLGLDDPPMILAHGAQGHAGADPEQQLRDAERELADSGLLDEAGIPDPLLAAALRRIAGFSLLVDTRFTATGAAEVRALVATDGEGAMRLVLADGITQLEGCAGEQSVAALLSALPDLQPAPGAQAELAAATVDRGVQAALDRGNGSDAAVADELVLLGVAERDVATLISLTCGDRCLYGQIGVTVRDTEGRRRRCPDIVQVVDTGNGRAAMWNWDGVLRVAPGSYELFHDLVCELVDRACRPLRH